MTITYTLDEISAVAKKIIAHATNNNKTFLFTAEMGVGKTTLIKEICKQLGVKDTISSPTYSLVNEYALKNDRIFHFDFYRIKHEEEAYDIGFEEYLDTNSWIFIEWPEKVSNLLPNNASIVDISMQNDNKRVVLIK